MTPWTVAHQVPLSMEFPRREGWKGLPCPPPGDLPNPGTEPRSLALQADSLLSEPSGKPFLEDTVLNIHVVPVIRGVPQFAGAAQ